MNLYYYEIRVMPIEYANSGGIKIRKYVYENVRETPQMIMPTRVYKHVLNRFIMTPTNNIYPEVKVEFYSTQNTFTVDGVSVDINEYIKYKITKELDRVKSSIMSTINDTTGILQVDCTKY